MRLLIFLILGFIHMEVSGQRPIGKYHDYFGHRLELNKDSTFKYEWRFDLTHTWALGEWTIRRNIIYLKFEDIKVYDTLVRANRPDSLIESRDEKSSRINEEEFAMLQMSSGGQSSEGITDRLLKKHYKLYLIDNKGRRVKERRTGIWPQKKWTWGYKKWPAWYVIEK